MKFIQGRTQGGARRGRCPCFQLYGERCGSMVPFLLRWIYAQIPIRWIYGAGTLDRLYTLLDFPRVKLGAKEFWLRGLSESVKLWRKKESFVISSIAGIHLSQREFNVCLDLMKYVISFHDYNSALLLKLGYIHMFGNLEGEKIMFERVENLVIRMDLGRG